jgi:DNA-binding XRE family transcriptional regulator
VGFRKAHLYTQVRLAQTLGISRRTVQYIEDEDFTAWGPNAETLARFRALAEMEKI